MNIFSFLFYFLIILISANSYCQVGIGTTSPNGMLDVSSTTLGVVYPKVLLTSTVVATPVINPNSGTILVGTTVYNTNTTATGTNDVFPGVYVWNGSKWIPQFSKVHFEYFLQTATLRSSSANGYEDVPGLGVASARSITAKYSGMYKVIVKGNFGGGQIRTPSSGKVNVAPQEGNFKFNFNTTDYTFGVKSFSAYNTHTVAAGTNYINNIAQFSKTIYLNLTAGVTYNFSLTFDQLPAPGFINNGNGGTLDGRGYVNAEVPCFIEFTYLEE